MKKDLIALETMEIQPLDDEILHRITGGCNANIMGICSTVACSAGFGAVCPATNAFGGGAHNGQGQNPETGGNG